MKNWVIARCSKKSGLLYGSRTRSKYNPSGRKAKESASSAPGNGSVLGRILSSVLSPR